MNLRVLHFQQLWLSSVIFQLEFRSQGEPILAALSRQPHAGKRSCQLAITSDAFTHRILLGQSVRLTRSASANANYDGGLFPCAGCLIPVAVPHIGIDPMRWVLKCR